MYWLKHHMTAWRHSLLMQQYGCMHQIHQAMRREVGRTSPATAISISHHWHPKSMAMVMKQRPRVRTMDWWMTASKWTRRWQGAVVETERWGHQRTQKKHAAAAALLSIRRSLFITFGMFLFNYLARYLQICIYLHIHFFKVIIAYPGNLWMLMCMLF